MKLKRYTAPDIKQAMAKVRDELGADAVILSNRKIADGIEIIAAMDYDDSIVKTPLKSKKEKNTHNNVSPRNKALAAHLAKTVDIKPDTKEWKKAFSENTPESSDHVAESALGEPLARSSDIGSQVSNKWLNQFKTNLENEDQAQRANLKDEAKSEDVQSGNTEELKNVWEELSSLRGLLETQLSSLAWNDVSKRKPVKTKILKHLLELGLTPDLSYELINNINDDESFESCWRKSLAMFASQLPVLQEDIVSTGGIFALVGPTGVGKTTTIAKLAARYALEHGTEGIALVTTDNYRIGAQEQLRTYGRILGTPVKVANNAEELRNILKGLYDKDLVLIDTAGMSQRDVKLTEQFSMLSEGSILIKSYLVISASSQQQVLDETVHAYKKAFLDGCIITKLDETLSLGGALATILQHKLPISYTSNGQRVPEDLHRASAIELVKSAVKMMNRVRIEMDENVVELAYGGIAANDVS